MNVFFVAPGAMDKDLLADDSATEDGSAVFGVHLLRTLLGDQYPSVTGTLTQKNDLGVEGLTHFWQRM